MAPGSRERTGSVLSTTGPPRAVLDAVASCPLPSLLLAVPSERILAASPVADRILCPDGGSAVGRSLEEFTADEPTGALELLLEGRLDGYEARRTIVRAGRSESVTVWLRLADPRGDRRFAMAFLLPDPTFLGEAIHRPDGMTAEAVVGSTDPHVIVDRISADVQGLTGHEPSDVVGQSLFRLVLPADVTALLGALAQSAATGLGATLAVRVQMYGSVVHRCQLLTLPLVPAPSFAFAFLDDDVTAGPLTSAVGIRQALWQFDESLRSATSSRLAARSDAVPGLNRLSGRELQIVTRLLNGDRVPAIAEALFLSPSTVRNHLSAVFRKLRVASQQELIHLLRRTDRSPAGS
ncbi:helix-turn-helix transcriptional regulator [Blastococcus saxobsidens]|uniref:Response regulator containing a CheY-like receiver domain and an HTH DNA-binding domain n=1 Tax=Blastococcus saxobsidens (strain DD2) TaxID=1146883 RepID=H6RKI1_BLASD|nr:LuxR C-terminal-related transcriptional regulator [Blastococcus saxobsidens]CCG02400.1 Response regulator containing a CheY-like receiver domain and an HTH DNA-binding domain [Blastococcus saxobsidens DD2]